MIRFHDVRHSFASNLAMRGTSLYKIANLLGHKHPKTTERYAHLAPESMELDVACLYEEQAPEQEYKAQKQSQSQSQALKMGLELISTS